MVSDLASSFTSPDENKSPVGAIAAGAAAVKRAFDEPVDESKALKKPKVPPKFHFKQLQKLPLKLPPSTTSTSPQTFSPIFNQQDTAAETVTKSISPSPVTEKSNQGPQAPLTVESHSPVKVVSSDTVADEPMQTNIHAETVLVREVSNDIAVSEAEEEDDDDMFADDTGSPKKSSSTKQGAVPVLQQELESTLTSNWDDSDGYYRVIIGEIFDSRYHILANLGKGMFSTVVKAHDKVDDRFVAIKIIRNNDVMYKAGMKESSILNKLNASDPDDKYHIVRLIRNFQYRGHLCLVFEGLSNDLRDLIKKFGRESNISMETLQSYARQIFLALEHLRKNNILHADFKPDNVFINEKRDILKVGDLGSASDASENDITPYLASRFYRAPELIIGLPYDFAIDMWSAGATLYELYSGKILFPGANNNNMLKVIMETRGKINHKVLRKGLFTSKHFDDQLNFLSNERDKLTGKPTIKTMPFAGNKPISDLRTRVLDARKTVLAGNEERKKLVLQFADLLDKCLNLNPEKRLTPAEALQHPFVCSA
ncbi:kinase-like domain-containing protein [Limtongia smithiae]|uniref:kinase-like domain-containing protein n=1 Tax=Limtongia smithiae TaxID=1125753 RepID=UPI0034CF836C